MLAGSIITETVFSWPGIGKLGVVDFVRMAGGEGVRYAGEKVRRKEGKKK